MSERLIYKALDISNINRVEIAERMPLHAELDRDGDGNKFDKAVYSIILDLDAISISKKIRSTLRRDMGYHQSEFKLGI